MSYKISVRVVEGEDYFTRITIKNCVDYVVTDCWLKFLRPNEHWSYYKPCNGEIIVVEGEDMK